MHKFLIELLLKYDFLEIVPMQGSFFKASILKQKVKLSPELLQLNYEKLSPIANPIILSYMQEDTIYIWFLKETSRDKKILIPESFLIYKALQNNHDGIFVFQTDPKQIYVLKEKKLQTAFVSHESIDSPTISIMKDEYNFTNVQIFDKKEHDKIVQNQLQRITFQELFAFMQFKIDRENLKKFFLEKLTYPIVSLLFLYMLVSYTQGYFLQKKQDTLMKEYQTFKTKNSEIKNAIRKHNKTVEKLQKFLKTEFEPVDPFGVVYDLYKVITKKDEATVEYFSFNNNNIKVKIKTHDNAIKYLKRFNTISYLKDVVIENTYKQSDGYKLHSYTMKIKEEDE